MNWQTVIAICLACYALGLYLLWSVVRDVNTGISAIQRPLDRCARMRDTQKEGN